MRRTQNRDVREGCQSVLKGSIQMTDIDVVDVQIHNCVEDDAKQTKGLDKLS